MFYLMASGKSGSADVMPSVLSILHPLLNVYSFDIFDILLQGLFLQPSLNVHFPSMQTADVYWKHHFFNSQRPRACLQLEVLLTKAILQQTGRKCCVAILIYCCCPRRWLPGEQVILILLPCQHA